MKKIRIGVIGAGFIGPAHIEALRRIGGVEVAALVCRDAAKGRRIAEQWGVAKVYGDYRELLRDPDIDAVHNCTPNHFHFPINRDCLLAGKHVMSEKPLATSAAESAELVRLARESGLAHGVNFNYRQFAIVQQLRAMAVRGEFGRIHTVHGSYLQDWLLYETDFNWRMSLREGGKSRAVADIGSHWCDLVQYVTGKRIAEVNADLATIHPTRKRPAGAASTFGGTSGEACGEDVAIATEDCAGVLLRFDDGSRGVMTVSQVSAGRKNRLSFQLDGTAASASWDQEQPEKLWVGRRDRANETLLADPSLFLPEAKESIAYPGGHNEGWPDALARTMRRFYEAVASGSYRAAEPPAYPTFEDGHRSMAVTEAMLRSHRTGRWVKVDPPAGALNTANHAAN